MKAAPTEREMDILRVLWERGEASVRDVHAALEPAMGLHFNTVQTLMRIMDDKGLVAHRRDGRTFRYRPTCTREQVSSRFLDRVFDGALQDLVLSMLKVKRPSDAELKQLEQLIADARQKKPRGRSKGK